MTRYFGSVPILSRLVLHAPAATGRAAAGAAGQTSAPRAPVSGRGRRPRRVASVRCGPPAKHVFGEEYLDVVTDGSFVERGRAVRIVEISGNRIMVREVE